jgi:hypothetical protein
MSEYNFLRDLLQLRQNNWSLHKDAAVFSPIKQIGSFIIVGPALRSRYLCSK